MPWLPRALRRQDLASGVNRFHPSQTRMEAYFVILYVASPPTRVDPNFHCRLGGSVSIVRRNAVQLWRRTSRDGGARGHSCRA